MLELFLLSGLGFAGIVVVLLVAVYIYNECNRNNVPTKSHRHISMNESEDLLRHPGNIYQTPPCRHHPPPSHPIYPHLSVPIHSVASAPLLTDLNPSRPPSRGRRTSTPAIPSTPVSIPELRAIQSGLIRNDTRFKQTDTDDASLIIGIHADLQSFSGYCVNVVTKQVHFYKVQKAHFPWQLLEQSDNAEFQMRNFSFALMAFYEDILAAKRFSIYIGSHVTTYDNNRLWRRAGKLLDHYMTCEVVGVSNEGRYFVSSIKDPKAFAVKILPAEDLANNNFEEFITFLSQYYQIPPDNFEGSHYIIPRYEGGQQPGQYERTELYQGYIDKVKYERIKYSKPCVKCGYFDNEAACKSSATGLGTVGWDDNIIAPIADI